MEHALMAHSDRDFWMAYFPEVFGDRAAMADQVPALKPRNLSASEITRWLVDSSRMMNISTTQWAKSAGLAPSTINRFVKGNGPNRLSARTIEMLQEFLQKEMHANAYIDFANAGLRQQVRVEIIGEILEGYREGFRTHNPNELSIALPSEYLGYGFYGLQVMTNKISDLREHDVVIGLPFRAIRAKAQHGQRYVFHERNDEDANFVSTTLRRLVVDPDGERWFVRVAQDDTSRALHWTDVGTDGYNDRCLLSLVVVGCIAYDDWIVPTRQGTWQPD